MRKYLKATHSASIRMFRTGNTAEIDAIDAHNDAVLADIIAGLFNDKYSYAYIRTVQRINNKDFVRLYVLTKSTRFADKLQMTVIRDDVPQYHTDISKPRDLYGTIPFGNYINICA